MVRAWVYHQTGPNSDLCSENGRILHVRHFRNIEISTNMATGDIETHSDRPRCLWGIGVGWDTPRCIKVGHTPTGTMLRPPRRHFTRKCMVMWGGFRLPSTESLKNQKQNARGRKGEGDGSGMGGGALWSVFCPRETHTRRLVDITMHISRRHKFREMRG